MSGPPDGQLPSSFDPEFYEENRLGKLSRKLREEPLIPIGCLLTCYALYQANQSIRVGDKERTNRMFRARIYAQAFTLLAVVAGGIYYKEDRSKRQKYDQALSEKKAQEKRDAWIRELEARDKEDREWRERHAAIEKAAREASDPPAVAKNAGKGAESESKEAAKSAKDAAAKMEGGVAKSVMELRDRRRGVLEAVRELVSRSQ